ncbi:MAG TPA: outer membrane beta-barrel protein [Kofleriaceae bacterium]|nr:outer membrane beta-barrel protein [Kofleriaceae bacterium]
MAASAGASTAFAQASPDDPNPVPSHEPPAGTAIPDVCPDESCPSPSQAPPPTTYHEPAPPPETEQERLEEEPFEKRFGLGISAGGGVSDWFDGDMRDVTGVAGTWEARAYVGLDQPFGVEVAYVGRASSLNPILGPDLDTDLVGNGVEAAARLNIFHNMVIQPYAIAGIGWTHFSVSNSDVTLTDFGVDDSDDILQIPLGAGAAYRAPFGLLVDARFTFRTTLNDGLVLATDVPLVNGQPLLATTFVDMDNWEVSGRIGYEF